MRMKCFGCYEVGTDGKFMFIFQEAGAHPQSLKLIEDRADAYEVGREYEILAVDPVKAKAIEEMFASFGEPGDPVHGKAAWRKEFLADYQNTVEELEAEASARPEALGEKLAESCKAKAVEGLFETPRLDDIECRVAKLEESARKHPTGPVILNASEHRNVPWFTPWEDGKAEDGTIGVVRLGDKFVGVREGAEIHFGCAVPTCVRPPAADATSGPDNSPASPTVQRIRAEFEARDRKLQEGESTSAERKFFGRVLKPWQRAGFTQAVALATKASNGKTASVGDWLVWIEEEVIDVIPRGMFQPFTGLTL